VNEPKPGQFSASAKGQIEEDACVFRLPVDGR
jgi:hypothetical protein